VTTKQISDEEFIRQWERFKSPTKMAGALGIEIRNLYARRRQVEAAKGVTLQANSREIRTTILPPGNARVQLGIENGSVIVFSDAHFWPGMRSTAFQGLLWAIDELSPKAVIANGDVFDGASISRHPRIGWDSTPSVIQELKACEAALGEIEDLAKQKRRNVKLVWTLGNHDARFESRLAANAPQYEQVHGFSLKDHFPAWTPGWSCWPTENICVKHRYKGGIHATHNNTVQAGTSIVTGHLHSLKVTPYSDYTGTRFGVDTGTLADTAGPQFMDYLEDSPVNWRSGFSVLTLHNGRLLWPELVHVLQPGWIEFRGQVIDVSAL